MTFNGKEEDKPDLTNNEDYEGMSKESEDAYNKRQNEPLFKSAKDMIPMEQVKAHFENLVCGYHKRDGCQLLVRDKSFYCCMWHQAMKAIGTDFFLYYNGMTDDDLQRMTAKQYSALEKRRDYMLAWMDNYPRGSIVIDIESQSSGFNPANR